MRSRSVSLTTLIGYAGFALVFLIVAAAAVWRGDILQAGMDPEVPFQTYDPPPAPDYQQASAWAMQDAGIDGSGPAAVFFIHSTTYDGGEEWNGPIGDVRADDYLFRVVIPNYAGPFARSGRLSIPRYRQGSLYTRLTLRDDAREARAFAYRDIEAAFEVFLARHPTGPIVIAGVEQGGELADRLVRERIVGDPPCAAGSLPSMPWTPSSQSSPPRPPCRPAALATRRPVSWPSLRSPTTTMAPPAAGFVAPSSGTHGGVWSIWRIGLPSASTRLPVRRMRSRFRPGCIWAPPTPPGWNGVPARP